MHITGNRIGYNYGYPKSIQNQCRHDLLTQSHSSMIQTPQAPLMGTPHYLSKIRLGDANRSLPGITASMILIYVRQVVKAFCRIPSFGEEW